MSFGALEHGKSIGLDANIFLYVATRHKRYGKSCETLLRRVKDGEITGVTSVIILDEVIYKVMLFEVMERYRIDWKAATLRLKNEPEVIRALKKPKRVLDDLIALGVNIKSLDLELIIVAEELSMNYGVRPHDAILAATLKQHGIENLATNDPDFERVDGITVWKPCVGEVGKQY